jgi:hypothetical protein
MILNSLASKSGLSTKGLEDLICGKAPNELASHLNTATSVVQEFIDGKANPGIANVFGITVDSAQELRNRLKKDGAIGVLIGICIERGSS